MFLKEEEKNMFTGILGTLALHLILVIVFLIGRIDKVKHKHQEAMVIEFDEQVYKSLDKMVEEIKNKKVDIQPLSQEVARNIAVNTANKLDKEISTEKYIDQVKEELGINELNQKLDRSLGDEPVLNTDKKQDKAVKKSEFRGRTTTSVFLEGRTIRHQEIPVYKCEEGGQVQVDISVNPEGEVVSASIGSTTTHEECLTQSALDAARLFIFSYKPDGEARQKGTITFTFFAQ